MTLSTSPRVTVVLTTFNRCQVLSDTIEMVLVQGYRDFELIISDDNSSDGTRQLCERLVQSDPRVRYRCNDTNLGMPGNLNAAIAESRGELIANLHDGDVYPADLLERWVNGLDHCPGSTFVFNAYEEYDEHGRTSQIWREKLRPCNPGADVLSLFYRRWRFSSPVWGTTMVRRSAYDAVGPFEPRFGFSSDVAMWMRLAEIGSVAYDGDLVIGLPSRKAVPRLHAERSSWRERGVLRRMFWESRVRSVRADERGPLELLRHLLYALVSESYFAVLAVRRKAITLLRSSGE